MLIASHRYRCRILSVALTPFGYGWTYEWLTSTSYISQMQIIWYFSAEERTLQNRVICVTTFVCLCSLGFVHLIISDAGWRLFPFEAVACSLTFCVCTAAFNRWREPVKIGLPPPERDEIWTSVEEAQLIGRMHEVPPTG
eukprot:gnl/TRDRNA2_/TRDRNA2_73563_c0_seq2.p1 gnl/TRDRNA2_/TRDRNA2_73563_c0~~gnl/TRDRNA2_/TRDRNA2_73563_c0_seq2.p1  ORF type:complete len:140 (+),score=12.90 gnl/TRDRNA2_/TRDRNA2_73563_c0_seq2:172-591(+)